MKHPVLTNREWLLIWWLVWLFFGLGQSLSFYLASGSFALMSLVDGITTILVFSGIALSLWYPFNFFVRTRSSRTSLVLNLIVSGLVTITLWLLISKHLMMLIYPDSENYQEFWDLTFPFRFGTGIFIYGLTILTYFLFNSLVNLSEKNAREAQLETLVRDIELKMLRSQINPHFLFNSLNSVSSLTVTDPEKARMMIVKLSNFMRYSLKSKDEQTVTLRSELENLRLYLDIEKVRFGDKLTYEEHTTEESLSRKIPVMLLQPLFENAVKHGVYESTSPVVLKLETQTTPEYTVILVSNNYETELTSAKGTGSGLSNVSRRLELFYGSRASISVSKENKIFSVSIYIPDNG